MKMSGATLNPNWEITELALHLPPLDIQLNMLTVKFMCKTLKYQDLITPLLAQVDGSFYMQTFMNNYQPLENLLPGKETAIEVQEI